MAGNMDQNDLQGVSDAMEELRKGSTLSAESLTKLGGNSTTAYKALEGYTKSLLGASGAIGGMAKAVAQGEGNFASLGSTIVGLTSVVGKLAGAIPLIGGAARALAEGVGEAAKFVLDQLDIMSKNYQTLGDASAGAVDGLDGLHRQFQAMGNYSLPAFTKAIKANTVGMAAFRSSATDGAEAFSVIAGKLTKGDIGERFLRLGMSLDGVGDAAINYVSISARMGLLQGTTTEELTQKTKNYIEEVDKIARMTGQTREQQQQEAQKSLLNIRFRAKLQDMADNGQADAAEQLRLYVEGMGGAAGDAARAWAMGIPATKEAAAANVISNDALRRNTMAVIAGKKGQDAINDTMVEGAAASKKFNTLTGYAGDMAGGAAGQFLDWQNIVREAAKNGRTPAEQAIINQKKQAEASGALTKDFTRAQMAVANSNKSLQDLGFSLAILAVPAVETFAEGLEEVTDFINDHFGNIAGSKKANAQNEENWNNMRAGSKVAHGMKLAGEWIAGMVSKDAQRWLEKDRMRAETKEFGYTQSERLRGVDSKLADAVTKAVAEYTAIPGKTATITSGVRTREKQQKLYDDWVAGGKKGMPVAEPGNSLHETGGAVDINKAAANDMDRLGILKKHGLTRPVAGDPVHVQLAENRPAEVAAPKETKTAENRPAEVAAPKETKTAKNRPAEVAAPKETKTAENRPAEVAAPKETKTATLSGPIDRNQTTVSKIDPVNSAGKPTQIHADHASEKQQASTEIVSLYKSIRELVSLGRQNNSDQLKILKYIKVK